jgi:hypothetical protein
MMPGQNVARIEAASTVRWTGEIRAF